MKKESLAVKVDGRLSNVPHSAVAPIHTATAYEYLGHDEHMYPRYFNTPNQLAVVERVRAMEEADDGVLFGSGMAAITTSLMAFLKPGDHAVLLDNLYGGTVRFVTEDFERYGITYTYAASIDEMRAAITDDTKVIYVESPTNPLLKIIDLAAVAELAASHGLVSIVDNTFASPINQNPATLGFDVVVHSGTKYLGGHSDLLCGISVGTVKAIEPIRLRAQNQGGTLDALACYLLERSLKTLAVRVQRQNDNALVLARFLEAHDAVGAVNYPGLLSHQDHAIAARQMSGFGGMLSFELDEGMDPTHFQMELRLILPAMSLGGVDSTICSPSMTSHSKIPHAARQRLGIRDELLRLSVGIEHADDLIADIERALAKTRSARRRSAATV